MTKIVPTICRLCIAHCGVLAEVEDDKFKLVWEPQMVVFKDGSKLTVPD